MAKEYKWAYPSDWLQEKMEDAFRSDNAVELKSLLNTCMAKMDEDDIQDLFQVEMDEDGYFKPLRRGRAS